jgi:hypothetical protein
MNKEECIDCETETTNYYPLKTNQGTVFKCRDCYELSLSRDQREEYNSSYQNVDLSIKIVERF